MGTKMEMAFHPDKIYCKVVYVTKYKTQINFSYTGPPSPW